MQQLFLNLYERTSQSLGRAELNGGAASCCLAAEREEPMPAGLLGLLLSRTFCAVSSKVCNAAEARSYQNDLLEALHLLQQEQRYVQRGQRQHRPQISAGQATALGRTGEMNI